MYAGTYSDPILGELEIFLDARGGLAARAGDLPYVLVSEGIDEFTAIVVPGMVERGRFEVSSDGTVEAVSFADGESETRFRRTGTKSRRARRCPSAGAWTLAGRPDPTLSAR
jgi:hypothetical protein